MGLSSGINDASTDSIPLLIVAAAAAFVSFFRSLLFPPPPSSAAASASSPSPALAALADFLNSNRPFNYSDGGGGDEEEEEEECVVCLSEMEEGERARRLGCRHVFHCGCLDGWLFDQMKLTCPLCRSPLVVVAGC